MAYAASQPVKEVPGFARVGQAIRKGVLAALNPLFGTPENPTKLGKAMALAEEASQYGLSAGPVAAVGRMRFNPHPVRGPRIVDKRFLGGATVPLQNRQAASSVVAAPKSMFSNSPGNLILVTDDGRVLLPREADVKLYRNERVPLPNGQRIALSDIPAVASNIDAANAPLRVKQEAVRKLNDAANPYWMYWMYEKDVADLNATLQSHRAGRRFYDNANLKSYDVLAKGDAATVVGEPVGTKFMMRTRGLGDVTFSPNHASAMSRDRFVKDPRLYDVYNDGYLPYQSLTFLGAPYTVRGKPVTPVMRVTDHHEVMRDAAGSLLPGRDLSQAEYRTYDRTYNIGRDIPYFGIKPVEPGGVDLMYHLDSGQNVVRANGAYSASVAVQQASKGGDSPHRNFKNFLATDKVPESIFGYPVVQRAEDYTPEDVEFFRANPKAAGFYDLEDGNEANAAEKGGDSVWEKVKRRIGETGEVLDFGIAWMERQAKQLADRDIPVLSAAVDAVGQPALVGARATLANLTSGGGRYYQPEVRDERYFSNKALGELGRAIARNNGQGTRRDDFDLLSPAGFGVANSVGGSSVVNGYLTDKFDVDAKDPYGMTGVMPSLEYAHRALGAVVGSGSDPDAGKVKVRIPLRYLHQAVKGGETQPVLAFYGKRPDGTWKGTGWLGELKLPGGGVAGEYSVGVDIDGKETLIPTLTPNLSKDEIHLMVNDIIPGGKKVPDAILSKAVAHARARLAEGQSPFKNDGMDPRRGFAMGFEQPLDLRDGFVYPKKDTDGQITAGGYRYFYGQSDGVRKAHSNLNRMTYAQWLRNADMADAEYASFAERLAKSWGDSPDGAAAGFLFDVAFNSKNYQRLLSKEGSPRLYATMEQLRPVYKGKAGALALLSESDTYGTNRNRNMARGRLILSELQRSGDPGLRKVAEAYDTAYKAAPKAGKTADAQEQGRHEEGLKAVRKLLGIERK